jgi:hypothetical protein
MNFILKLQEENKALLEKNQMVESKIIEFRAHLASPKFQSQPLDNYISTKDVENWLNYIREV